MVKTVQKLVTVAHSHALRRFSRHECLVDINRMDQSREFVVWGFKGNGRLPFQFGDHPSRDRKSEQVAYQLLDMAVGPRR